MTEPNNQQVEFDINDILNIVETNEEVANQLQAKFVNPDTVKSFLHTPEGEKVVAPIKDAYASKAIEGWKSKNLDRIIQEEVQKLNPPETKEQRELQAMQQRLAAIEKDKQMLEQQQVAAEELSKLGLPSSFSSYIVGDSTEVTKHKAKSLEVEISNFVKQTTDTAIQNYGAATAPSNVDTATATANKTLDDPYEMGVEEASKLAAENPVLFAKMFGDME